MRGITVEDYFYKITKLDAKHVEVIKKFSAQSPEHLQLLHASSLQDFLLLQYAESAYQSSGARVAEVEQLIHAAKCNTLENLHGAHERAVIPVLKRLAEGSLDVLDDSERMLEFMSFLGQQITRTKTFRDGAVGALSRQTAQELEFSCLLEHAWWFLSYIFGMNLGSVLYLERHVNKHVLLINNTETPFITSDQPIANVHVCISETVLEAPEYADFFYPISPRIAYMVCDSERFPAGKVEVDEAVVLEMNWKMASQAMLHIVGDSEEAIRPFMKYVGKRFHNKKLQSGEP